jgi:hypothetical protein
MADKTGEICCSAGGHHGTGKAHGRVAAHEESGFTGKRRTAGWQAKQVLLKEESIQRATERLKARHDRTDFSDLVQALLEASLETPK